MLLAEAGHESEALWQGYLDLLQSGPHWMFEITLILIFDVIIGLILWPLIKKAVKKHDREVHHKDKDSLIVEDESRWAYPPTVYECIDHLLEGGKIEEQTKGWRHSGNGGQWVEATFNLEDYREWVRKDVPRGFLRLVPIED